MSENLFSIATSAAYVRKLLFAKLLFFQILQNYSTFTHNNGTSFISCSFVIFTPILLKPIVSAASLIYLIINI